MYFPKHFILEELVDRMTFETKGETAWALFRDDALIMIDGIREFFGAPVRINNWHLGGQFQFRGYRPPDYQGGAKYSMHRLGGAFDMDVIGLTADQAREKIMINKDNPLLIKIMRMEHGVNWLHCDVRPLTEHQVRIWTFNP
ncbi:MAG: hypothetical protein UY48_C0046G0001 [Candidatus Gottesmanbacteria bacterium GW2011_GWB1_49_7]|uniref:Uncharacterized protein n=1 Tax=Candidatus Gottesmanbacteria bacterium GW2011_GWB1_49_7 TaxID=1618448 RepID=A0A0G1Y5N1_9BACT|nr:MAG: hypothetical protein UY48_C0046G0001 [Candidatus Gottesmanbacteria bacterium GW2011_GWB1_49_7]